MVTPATDVQCYGCGWKGVIGQSAQSVYLDMRPGMLIPASQGGNGKNFRCPKCRELIFYTRYDNNRKIIGPSGHQYRDAV
jgi:hypothetical protein